MERDSEKSEVQERERVEREKVVNMCVRRWQVSKTTLIVPGCSRWKNGRILSSTGSHPRLEKDVQCPKNATE